MNNLLYSNGLQELDSSRAETAETAKTPGSDPGHLRLLLGPRASAALTAAGENAFVVIGKASLPDDPTRWAIHILPVTMKTACDAIAVATGEAKATRPRVKAPPAAPEAVTATIDGTTAL